MPIAWTEAVPGGTVSPEVQRLLPSALVWDMVWPLEPWCGNDWASLRRFQDAGFDVISVTLAGDNHNVSEAVQRVAAARRAVTAKSDSMLLVESVDDISRAQRENKLAVAFHFEGTRCFERNLDVIEAFHALGIRHTLLAFNRANSAGGGCAEKADGGLSNLGREIVAEMQRVGMLVDLSHTGRLTAMDVLENSAAPVVFSHSNADAVAPHYRNVPDELARACAATGGLLGVSSSNEYLGVEKSSPEAIFQHIDHFAELVGSEHVGLGLDIVFDSVALSDWVRTRPDEWPGADDPSWPGFNYAVPEDIGHVVELMAGHGYAETDVRNILGENYRRICGAAWN